MDTGGETTTASNNIPHISVITCHKKLSRVPLPDNSGRHTLIPILDLEKQLDLVRHPTDSTQPAAL